MSLIKLWWPYVMQRKVRIGIVILLGVITSYLTLLLPLSIGKFIDILFAVDSSKVKILGLMGINMPSELPVFFVFFASILILKFFMSWLYYYYVSLEGETFTSHLRTNLFNVTLLSQKPSHYPNRLGLIIPFGSDLKTLQRVITKGLIGFVADSIFFIMALYILFKLDMFLTIIVFLMTILFYLIHRLINKVSKPLFGEKRKKFADLLRYITRLSEKEDVSKEVLTRKFNVKNTQLNVSLGRVHARKTFLKALSSLMLYVMLAVIMSIIIFRKQVVNTEPSMFITYFLLLMTLFPTLRNLIRIEHIWTQASLAARKYFNLVTKTDNSSTFNFGNTGNKTKNSVFLLQKDKPRQL